MRRSIGVRARKIRRAGAAGQITRSIIEALELRTLLDGQNLLVSQIGQWGGAVNAVEMVGTMGYMIEGPALVVMDLSDSVHPQELGRVVLPDLAQGVRVVGSYAYVADTDSGLQIIDISNPAAPTLAGTFDTSGSASGVSVVGNYAYVADGHNGLQIVDISGPTVPTFAGSYDTSGSAHGVSVVGSCAYVADAESGLQIIDISNPTAPTLASSYDTPGLAFGVSVVGSYAYVADDTSGLQILNISNPAAPTLAGTYDTPGQAFGVSVVGSYAYVADGDSGLQILDVSNPAAPMLAGTYDTPGDANGVSVAGDLVYVADNDDGGLAILHVQYPPTDLQLSTATIAENLPAGSVVGQLSSVDADPQDSFTYTLVSGPGDSDNASFSIVGDEFGTAAAFDFEARDSYSIRVRVTDQVGFWFEKAFTISISNVNEAPMASVALGRHSPYSGEVLTAAAAVSDPEGDAATLLYTWKVNGTVVKTTQTTALTDTLDLSQPGNGDVGDSIAVEVTATDSNGLAGAVATDSATVMAGGLVVTTTMDVVDPTDGVISLREAIANAGPADVVSFDRSLAGGTIVLNGTELTISGKDLTIQGLGAEQLTISGNDASRVFNISGSTVNLKGLTISGGYAYAGGGIFIDLSTATLSNCALVGNSTSTNWQCLGGALYVERSTLTINNSSLNDNRGPSEAMGGALAGGGATITINNSALARNSASNWGGAIYIDNCTLTINGSTLQGNSAREGGAIYSGYSSTLVVNGSAFSDNSSSAAGAISNMIRSVVRVNGSTFTGNRGGYGGAIWNDWEATAVVYGSTFQGNSAYHGGAICNSYASTAVVEFSSFRDNAAGYGGALSSNDDGTLTVTGSTFSGNYADYGGAIRSNATVLSLRASTLSGNSAQFGGGIYSDVGSAVRIWSSTLSANTAHQGAGALYNDSTSVVAYNSILSGNTLDGVPDDLVGGLDASSASNLIGAGGESLRGVRGNLVGVADPKLGPLQNNGGPTWTMALLHGSPAWEAGDNGLIVYGNFYDQRNAPYFRVSGAKVDIGAYESQWELNAAPVVSDAEASVSHGSAAGVDIALSATDSDGDPLTYSIVTAPAHGTVTIDGTVAHYVPDRSTDYVGDDLFTFQASDGWASSDTATVSLHLTNAGPATSVTLSNPAPYSGEVLTASVTASDPDGDPVTLLYTWTVNGTVVKTTTTTSLTDVLDLSQPGNGDVGDSTLVEVTPTDPHSLAGEAAIASATVAAGGLVVTTTADVVDPNDGLISLREAIANAASGDTVGFDPALAGGTIVLNGSELVISSKDLAIQGLGASLLTVSADNRSGVFAVAYGTASITGLTITGGHATYSGAITVYMGGLSLVDCKIVGNRADQYGGAVTNYFGGHVTVDRSVISGNSAATGGAVFSFQDSALTLRSSTISGNSASQDGGAIWSDRSCSVSVERSLISDNTAQGMGGAIYAIESSTLSIRNSTLRDNSARGNGGAVAWFDGTWQISGSTFSGNITGDTWGTGQGGAIYSIRSSGVLANSTVGGNLARSAGGAIVNWDGTLTLQNSTIVGNRGFSWWGAGVCSSPGTAVATNSIIAGNIVWERGETRLDIIGGLGMSSAHNLLGFTLDTSLDQFQGVNGNVVGVTDPGLGALQDNGGPTWTMAVLPGSPAFNAGDNSLVPAGAVYDQRGIGYGRVVSGVVDIGAFETAAGPSDVTLAGSSVAENLPAGAVVGYLISTDAEAGDGFSYVLVAGAGSDDNGRFEIVGNEVRTKESFDFETTNRYAIRVRSTDSSGFWMEKSLTVGVIDVVEQLPLVTDIVTPGGTIGNRGQTNNSSLTLAGTSEPGMLIRVYDQVGTASSASRRVMLATAGGTVIGSTYADAAGSWTIELAGLSQGQHQISVGVCDTLGNEVVASEAVSFTVDSVAPQIGGVAINDGSAQRSMVKKVAVVFSEAVTLSAGALQVKLQNGALPVNTTVTVANPSGDQKSYVLSFSGTGAIGGSLADGIYDLLVSATGVQDLAGNALTADYSQRFHRLFGDSDGNKVVNALDYARLKNTFARSASDPLFNSAFDYEANNLINALDLARFRQRYGLSYSY